MINLIEDFSSEFKAIESATKIVEVLWVSIIVSKSLNLGQYCTYCFPVIAVALAILSLTKITLEVEYTYLVFIYLVKNIFFIQNY